jgi:hypothetical protein
MPSQLLLCGIRLWQSGRRGKPGGPPRGTEALLYCERLEENPSPGLTCWGFLRWLFQGKITRWQPTPVVSSANSGSFSCCNYAPLIHQQPETDQDRPVNTLRNPDARVAISLPVEVLWFKPMLD